MFQHNNDIEWYALITAPLILLWIAAFFFTNALVRFHARRAYLFTRGWCSSARCPQVTILLSVFIVANTLALGLNVRGRGQVARCSGMLATITLAILLAGAHLDITAAIQGVPLRSHIRIHKWLSFVTLWTATLHVFLNIINSGVSWTSTEIWGFTVSSLSFVSCRPIEQKIPRPCFHSQVPHS